MAIINSINPNNSWKQRKNFVVPNFPVNHKYDFSSIQEYSEVDYKQQWLDSLPDNCVWVSQDVYIIDDNKPTIENKSITHKYNLVDYTMGLIAMFFFILTFALFLI